MRIALAISCTLLSLQLAAQVEGDELFGEDQIIDVHLNFSQPSFWDSLVANYATTTYMLADLTLTDNTGTYTFDSIAIRLKGNSSYSHPGNKKSFKIDFNKYVSGQNYDGLKKLNFSNGFKDPTLMREKIFSDFSLAAGVPAPRANFANVYFNGTQWGFYSVIEQIDDQFLDWCIQDDDGNLFKAGDNFGGGPGGGDAADLLYYGADQSGYIDRYELKTNEVANDWSDLIDLLDFINNSTPSDFENGLANHMELQEYLRSAAIDILFSNLDSYTGSARNFYLYHNLTTGLWEWIKWDANETFGTYGGMGLGDMTTLALNYHDSDRPLLENVFNSPTLYAQYNQELCYLKENFFSSAYLVPKIDSIKDLIKNAVYADNNKMYTDANFDNNIENDITSGGGPMGGTFYGLKSFIQARASYLEGAVDCSTVSYANDLANETISLYPNPASTSVFLEWSTARIQSIAVYNVLGSEVHTEKVNGKIALRLDVSGMETGLYFISLISENGRLTQRLIVE